MSLYQLVKLKNTNLFGKVVGIRYDRGKIICIKVSFPNGSTWEGPVNKVIVYE